MVPLAVAIMVAGLSAGAWATPQTFGPITLDANYSLAGGATVDGMTDPSSNLYPPGGSSDGADFYLFKSDTAGNNVFFHTYGFVSSPTYFGARASGEGHFAANTRTTLSQIFTNNTGVAQMYNFAFDVDWGEVSVLGTGDGFASLLLDIKKNGSSVAKDFTSITQTGSSVTCADDDNGLAYMSCAGANVSSAVGFGGLFNVSMGTLNPGESFTLDYDIIATVSGNLTAGSGIEYRACDSGDNGYGEAAAGEVNEDGNDPDKEICSFNTWFPGSAIARSGDPFNGPQFGTGGPSASTPANFSMTNAPANGVPEPGSMALIGLALAGLAATRRRKA